jgi:PAS domain S-box-containing protein
MSPRLPSGQYLEALMSDDVPSFGVDGSQKILMWNGGMEQLTGYAPDEVLKKYCFDILRGKDTFGNNYCNRHCPIIQNLKRHEDIYPFEMLISKKAGGDRLRVRCEHIVTTDWTDNSTICVYRVQDLGKKKLKQ